MIFDALKKEAMEDYLIRLDKISEQVRELHPIQFMYDKNEVKEDETD